MQTGRPMPSLCQTFGVDAPRPKNHLETQDGIFMLFFSQQPPKRFDHRLLELLKHTPHCHDFTFLNSLAAFLAPPH